MTTIGGVLFRHLDAMPKVGDYVSIEGFDLTVMEMDGHRIAEVQARKGVLGDEDIESLADEHETPPSARNDGNPSRSIDVPLESHHQAEVVALPTRDGHASTQDAVKPDGNDSNGDDVSQGGGQG